MEYGQKWNQYYQKITGKSQHKALWDVPAKDAVELDMPNFIEAFSTALPIIDLGCGTGTQSVALAEFFPKVIGLDVAATAIEIAQNIHEAGNLIFDVIDESNANYFKELHETHGDMNIYMRGVLHQILPKDLNQFAANISQLLGKKGKLYFIEVSDSIRNYFEESSDAFSQLPSAIRRTFTSNLPPRGLNEKLAKEIFDENIFSINIIGESKLYTNINFINGSPIFIPALTGTINVH